MPNFTVFGSDSVARTLANNEEGVIGTNGNLIVQSGNAVTATGNANIAVLGSIVGVQDSAIAFTGSGIVEVVVAEGGVVTSLEDDAIKVGRSSGNATAQLINNGNISGTDSDAVEISNGSGAAYIQNTGVISANDNAVYVRNSNEIRLINTGEMTSYSGTTVHLQTNASQTAHLFNSGSIVAGREQIVGVLTASSDDTIINTGEIFGRIEMGSGEDIFNGIHGSQFYVDGSFGDDIILAGANSEELYGGDNDDRIFGNGGGDSIFGGNGNDKMRGGAEADDFDGGAGVDWVYYQNSDAGVQVDLISGYGYEGHAEGDTYVNVENVWGTQFRDELNGNASENYLVGGSGNDIMRGYDGNDQFRGDAGADIMNGGSGVDRLVYSASNGAVNVNLTLGTASGGHATGDRFFNMEYLTGSQYGDRLTGSSGNNQLFGLNGDDIIRGYFGNDLMAGGGGADTFVFDNNGGRDIITDFQNDVDKLDLSVYNYASAAQVLANATVVGNDVFIIRDANDSIRLVDFAPNIGDLADDLIL